MRLPDMITKMSANDIMVIKSLPLTEEETIIIDRLLKGDTVYQIACDLAMSDKTIYRRIRNIKNKYKSKSKSEMEKEDMEKVIDVDIKDKVLLTLPEASAISNIGLTKMNEITNSFNCPFVFRVGTKRLIKKKEFVEFISKTSEI